MSATEDGYNQLVIFPTDIPGLFDILLPGGVVRSDMTVGQVQSIARARGLDVVPGWLSA